MRHPLAIALCLAIGAGRRSAQSGEWLLTPSRAGKIVVGMTVDALYSAYGRENVTLVALFPEGMFTPAVQVFVPSEPGAPIAIANINQVCGQFRVTGISIVSPRLRTRDGLGVGSTVAEVRRRQPTAKLNREEGPSLIVEKLQMTFAIADATFADSTRVLRVWAWAPLPDSVTRCRR